jgi:hypothetical protein
VQHQSEEFEQLLGVVIAQAMVVGQSAFDTRIDEDTALESLQAFAYAARDFVRFVDGLPAETRDLPEWGETPTGASLDRFRALADEWAGYETASGGEVVASFRDEIDHQTEEPQ